MVQARGTTPQAEPGQKHILMEGYDLRCVLDLQADLRELIKGELSALNMMDTIMYMIFLDNGKILHEIKYRQTRLRGSGAGAWVGIWPDLRQRTGLMRWCRGVLSGEAAASKRRRGEGKRLCPALQQDKRMGPISHSGT
jgi:hypothetical protein